MTRINNITVEAYELATLKKYVVPGDKRPKLAKQALFEAALFDGRSLNSFSQWFANLYGLRAKQTPVFDCTEAEYALGLRKRVITDFEELDFGALPFASAEDCEQIKLFADACHNYDERNDD